MNKSLVTNSISIGLIFLGHFSPFYSKQILSVGYFAFSGAITNWLAIYMLFEKIPGLYGSGVIPARFGEFKAGIKSMMMSQFFTNENIDKFFHNQNSDSHENSLAKNINFDKILSSINYDKVFENLVNVVMESSLGGMLGMLGGAEALTPMKAPFVSKMQETFKEVTSSDEFLNALEENILPSNLSEGIVKKVEEIVDQRLEELTPQAVKEIIQEMIKKHLGWLVVWGGVFGGLIGLMMSVIN